MSILALSGWGQPHDALSAIAPDALHFDYGRYETEDDALAAIAHAGRHAKTVIGWSLGGQLALRLIAQGMLKPQKLVLIAAPFQFVETASKPLGMKRDLHEKFRGNFISNPERTLNKSWELIIKDDRHEEKIRSRMQQQDKQTVLSREWLGWLDALERFSCDNLDMGAVPPTLILHGEKDVVISPEQSLHFVQRLPKATLHMLPDCGHAPHWHDCAHVAQLIRGHADV
jgi:pimeloyl-[acyl-carrier protein] methyl ester esterase